MSSSGTPPKGDSAPLDDNPNSPLVESSAGDQAGLDIDIDLEAASDASLASPPAAAANAKPEAAVREDGAGSPPGIDSRRGGQSSIMPRSLSPVVLANEGRVLSEPPMTAAKVESLGPKAAELNPERREEAEHAEHVKKEAMAAPVGAAVSSRFKPRSLWIAAAALTLVVPFLVPKRVGKPRSVAAPSARAPEVPRLAASASIDLPPLVTVAASSAPPPDAATAISSASPAKEAASSAAASAASVDSFAEAFQRHAANRDPKWASLKPRAEPSTSGAALASSQSEWPKAPKPDTMAVLKQLEESRKAKRQ
ncbi:MAG: hypothetical protein ACM3ZE_02880 [Myxococcales bacterium]